MARAGTVNYNIGMWLDGEAPGAGAQGSDSNALNGNWYKIDAQIKARADAIAAHAASADHDSRYYSKSSVDTMFAAKRGTADNTFTGDVILGSSNTVTFGPTSNYRWYMASNVDLSQYAGNLILGAGYTSGNLMALQINTAGAWQSIMFFDDGANTLYVPFNVVAHRLATALMPVSAYDVVNKSYFEAWKKFMPRDSSADSDPTLADAPAIYYDAQANVHIKFRSGVKIKVAGITE